MQEHLGATRAKLSAADMKLAAIGVFGDRAAANLKPSYDIGISLDITSEGTNGKKPLAKN